MNTSLSAIHRKIIPRWRDSAVAATTGELKPLSKPIIVECSSSEELTDRIGDWKENQSLAFASDLISAGVVLGVEGNEEVSLAADYIRSLGFGAPTSALSLARFVSEGTHDDIQPPIDLRDEDVLQTGSRSQIQELKHRVRNYPRNALAWVDMARHYTTLGAYDQAIHSIDVGLMLAPDSRFVLRSASRLYVHLGQSDRAYDILHRSPATRNDPWLRAAEIAVAELANKAPPRWGQAKKLLRNTDVDTAHISELATAIATVELTAGSGKSARRHFDLGLENPTENAVAQAHWATEHIKGISLNEDHLLLPRTFEARATGYFAQLDFEKCVEECAKWSDDEPFSSRPLEIAIFASIVGLENFSAAIRFARLGLISNPNNFALRNNLCVALAEAGYIDSAKEEYDVIKAPSEDAWEKTYWLATRGLIAFKECKKLEGREWYKQAVAFAQTRSQSRLESLALLHWACEELKAGDAFKADEIAERAVNTTADLYSTVMTIVVDKYKRLRQRWGLLRDEIPDGPMLGKC